MHLIQLFLSGLPKVLVTASSWGGAGVHAFFIVSGIGLYLSYKRKPLSYLSFLKRRFLKIFIPYLVVILISFFVPYMYDGNDRILALLSHILLFKMFIPKFETSFGEQFWFISTIIQFYLLFIPLYKIKEHINSRNFILVTFLISFSWWAITTLTGINTERIFGSFCLQYLWEFALGMIIAELFIKKKQATIRNHWLFIVAILSTLLYGVLAVSNNILRSFNDIPSAFSFISVSLLIYQLPLVAKIFLRLSTYSYELYLTHILIFTTIFHFVPKSSLSITLLTGIAALMASIIAAKIFHNLLKTKRRL